MPRARNIKPSIMDNEELAELSATHRLLFIYLWMLADKQGRLEDRPKRIAAQALPYDRSADVDEMLDDLACAGFLIRYQSNNIKCIQIVNFSKHQHPHNKEKDSELPSPDLAEESPVITGQEREVPSNSMKNPSDSLIPDSLIPDCGVDGADAPRKRGLDLSRVPEDMTEPIREFVQHRKNIKKPLTQNALNRFVGQVVRVGGELDMSPAQVVEITIDAGWAGVESDWIRNRLGGRSREGPQDSRKRSIADDLTDTTWAH